MLKHRTYRGLGGFGRLLAVVAALAAAHLTAADAKSAEAAGKAKLIFRAGAATSNITPWLGDGIVGGWDAPPAQHIHDELHARCLVLDDGTTRLALVVADSVGIPREVFDEAKREIHERTGLAPERMLMSASHTHSATSARPPNVLAPAMDLTDLAFAKELTEYQRFLARRISDGVRRAINQLEPARVAWGTVDEPRQVFNRRWFMKPGTPLPNPFGGMDQVRMNPSVQDPRLLKPAGPVNPQIVFLSVQAVDGRPIALLANYSLHYVGDTGPLHISADYFAMFADRIQQLIGADRLEPPFVGIMSNGTSGNVNNINFTAPSEKKKPYQQMRLVADQVAQDVFGQYRGLQYHEWVPLRMSQRELDLAVRKPSPEQLARAKELLAGPKLPDKLPYERDYAESIIKQEEGPATVRVIVQCLRIGELGIAAIPFETFVETGLEIKAKSPLRPTFTISLANGIYGYLPTPEHHKLGGYETWLGTSKVEPEASTKIVRALLEMFNELHP